MRPLFLNGLFVLLALVTEATAADIFPVECDLVIVGQIETPDAEKFQNQLVEQLKRGCASPKIFLYSPGGRLGAAIQIGKQVYQLQLTTVAPELNVSFAKKNTAPRNGPRICTNLPGSEERIRLQKKKALEQAHAIKRWLLSGAKGSGPPDIDVEDGDFNPRSGVGDPRCACASACFFIWAAGSERKGDVIEIHRPYFDPQEFARLDARDARGRYQALMTDARAFLSAAGIQSAIIERMFSIDSQNAAYLSAEEINSLRMAPDLSELKSAKCGPEPREEDQSNAPDNYKGWEFEDLTPQERRWFVKRAEREICWREAQKELRQAVINEFLQSAQVAAVTPPPAPAASPTVGTPDSGLSAYAGKYPFDLVGGKSIFQQPTVRDAITKLAKKQGSEWIGGLTVAGPIGLKGDVLTLSVCQAHNCNRNNASLIIKTDGTLLALCRYSATGEHGARPNTLLWQGPGFKEEMLNPVGEQDGCPWDEAVLLSLYEKLPK